MEVEENFTIRSIGAEKTFEEDTNDWILIDRELMSLSDVVHTRLCEERMAYRTVVLKIRFKEFETYTRSKSLKFPTTQKNTILEIVSSLSVEFRSNRKEVRLVGVRLAGLSQKLASTIDSFANPN